MSLRAPKDTIESLRLTLQRLEQTSDAAQDPEARAELRRILLLRIANLEALEALKSGTAQEALEIPRPAPPSPVAPPLPPQVITSDSPAALGATPPDADPS